MSRPERGQEIEVEIERMAYGGRGVARHEGFVVFVPMTAPGDRVRARVWRTRRRFAEADLLSVEAPGAARTEAPCPYYGACGGCSWQHLDYGSQLEAKEAIVRESLQHLAGLTDPPLLPIVPSPKPFHYRNKMEFAFHPETVLGLHRRGKFDEVLEIDDCLLPDPRVREILATVKDFVLERGLSRWDKATHEGFLRHLVFREGRGTQELMVALVTAPGELPDKDVLAERLAALDPRVQSVLWAQSASISDSVTVDRIEVLHGRDHIFETLGGVRYAIRLETFFQTNPDQAERLAEVVLRHAAPEAHHKVVDLYCGVGAFALLFAPHVSEVVGIEVVAPSIEAARENAERAGIGNARFLVGDARRTLPGVLEEMGEPDLLVIDPPRSGAGGKVMRRIGRSRTRRVVYVSCNPTTLAPDLAWLLPYGYEVKAVEPVDMFPQTYHVETVVLLERVRDPDPGIR